MTDAWSFSQAWTVHETYLGYRQTEQFHFKTVHDEHHHWHISPAHDLVLEGKELDCTGTAA